MTATTTPPRNGQLPPTDSLLVQQSPIYGSGPPDVPPPVGRVRWYRRRWLIALGALLVGIGVGAAVGSTKAAPRAAAVTAPAQTVIQTVSGPTKTKTVVRNVPGPTKTVTQTAQPATPVPSSPSSGSGGGGSAGGQHFSGTDTQNLGTINVSADSTLRWTCPGCSSANFIISNDFGDANTIDVNSLNQTSGQTVVSAGTYTKVTVLGSGNWSFDITPG